MKVDIKVLELLVLLFSNSCFLMYADKAEQRTSSFKEQSSFLRLHAHYS